MKRGELSRCIAVLGACLLSGPVLAQTPSALTPDAGTAHPAPASPGTIGVSAVAPNTQTTLKKQQDARQRKIAKAKGAKSDTPAMSSSDSGTQNVTVTGTRIRRAGMISDSPVTTLTSDELRWRGIADVNAAINQETQVTPNVGNRVSNIQSGAETVNLRGLGAGRTLLLIDGTRTDNDTTGLPGALIQRVDILTGGASAVYGSDAVAGVVNTILKKNFDGIEFDGESDFQEHRNGNDFLRGLLEKGGYAVPPGVVVGGQKWYGSLAAGKNFDHDRGNFSLFGGYKRTLPLASTRFDQSACVYNTGSGYLGDVTNDIWNCAKTTRDATGRVYLTDVDGNYTGAAPLAGASTGMFTLGQNGVRTFRTETPSDVITAPNTDFVYRGEKVANAGATTHYDIVPGRIEFYGTALWSRDDTLGEAPINANSPFGADVDMPCDNPYLSQSQGQALCGSSYGNHNVTRDVYIETYPQDMKWKFSSEFETIKGLGGFKGNLFDDIDYDISGGHWSHQTLYGDTGTFQATQFANALTVTSVNGKPTCTAVVSGTDKSCIPFDPFSTTANNSASYGYWLQNGSTDATVNEEDYDATITGSLKRYGLKSPFARQGVNFALNYEHRDHSEGETATGYDTGFISPYTGSVSVNEYGAELDLPMVQNKPGIKDFSIDIGGRTGSYTTYGKNVSTWKLGFDYAPTRDIAFRGSFNRSIRVAIEEALAARIVNTSNEWLDLCAPPGVGATVQRYSYSRCAVSGMTQAQYNALSKYTNCTSDGYCPSNTLYGGNPDLMPERSTSFTLGAVLTPRWLTNFRASADFYRIKIVNDFTVVDPGTAFSECYDDHYQYYCNLYHRDPSTGLLSGAGYVDDRYSNGGYQITQGVDLALDYHWDIPRIQALGGRSLGSLNFGYNGTFVTEFLTEDAPGLKAYDCTGYFGGLCGGGRPGYRHNARVTWEMPWLSAALTVNWRMVHGMDNSVESSNPRLTPSPTLDAGIYRTFEHVPDANYIDLGFGMPIGKRLHFNFNVQNLFDVDPPLVSAFYAGSSISSLAYYDTLGRTVTTNVSANF